MRLLRPSAIAGFACLLALAACSSSSSSPSSATDAGAEAGTVTLSVTGYDVSCKTNSDCVLVETGSWPANDPCCGRGCPSAAINVADQSKYEAAAAATQKQCMPPGTSGCGIDCALVTAFCNAGTCDTCMSASCGTAADAGDAAAE